jgi:hypothetical protein
MHKMSALIVYNKINGSEPKKLKTKKIFKNRCLSIILAGLLMASLLNLGTNTFLIC